MLYPLGAVREQRRVRGREELDRFTLADLPPVQRGLLMGDVVAAGTPILLVHGLVDNRSVFTLLRRALRRRGFGQVLTLNYSPFTHDVRAAAARLAELVERTCEETGYEKVHVVGHSLGGAGRALLRAAHGRARPACTPSARSARRTAAPGRRTCSRTASCASCDPARTCMSELDAARAGLPHPLRVLLERPGPAHRPAAQRADRSTPTCRPATCCCAGWATCRCPSTAGSSARSPSCWRTSTPTARRSPPASRRSPPAASSTPDAPGTPSSTGRSTPSREGSAPSVATGVPRHRRPGS